MQQIQNLTDDALQQQRIVLPDGTSALIQLRFSSQQNGWFFNEITRLGFTLKGLRVTTSPNMLRQFKNILPFGLACYVGGNREPTQKGDFISGAANLYLLDQADVLAYEKYLQG